MNAIREEPLKYLPEVSLMALWMFRQGYVFRYYMEGHSLEDDVDDQAFDSWIRARFGVSRAFFNNISIVRSFAANDAEAFHDYFALRDEFLRTANTHEKPAKKPPTVERMNQIDLLKKIRERPALYLGTASFRSCSWFLMGEERAYSDLGLPVGEDRKIFSEFKEWVEQIKNNAGRPRPWHVIVSYYGTGCDCGNTVTGAFTLFYRWLDKFAATRGQPSLFKVAENWWECKPKHPNVNWPSWP
jgi:hypothetical protein